jgi:hypothetical protein
MAAEQQSTLICRSCGKQSGEGGHLCDPVSMDKMCCTYCGGEFHDVRYHICREAMKHIEYSCNKCGRVSVDNATLCYPEKIE